MGGSRLTFPRSWSARKGSVSTRDRGIRGARCRRSRGHLARLALPPQQPSPGHTGTLRHAQSLAAQPPMDTSQPRESAGARARRLRAPPQRPSAGAAHTPARPHPTNDTLPEAGGPLAGSHGPRAPRTPARGTGARHHTLVSTGMALQAALLPPFRSSRPSQTMSRWHGRHPCPWWAQQCLL